MLTPIPKKGKDLKNPASYRGITVTSIICKVLEMCIRARIEGTLGKHQNRLQRGFTKGSSSINTALLITEAINEAKDRKKPLILVTLDAEKAFDVVDHTLLFWKLYEQNINGPTWLLIKNLHHLTTTKVKSAGCTSRMYSNNQGVRQGGILSTFLYKVYNTNILDTLERNRSGYVIGDNFVGAPTCADDVMLIANSAHIA